MSAVRASKALGEDHRKRGCGNGGLGALGRGCDQLGIGFIPRTWDKIKHQDVTCIVLAMLFSAVFVVPPILVFGDRSLPFEYVHTYPRNEFLHAGETGTNVFVVTDVKKHADGQFSRYFTDAKGNRFYLGTYRTSYEQGLKSTGERTFEKDWTVPRGAKPGPGLYETEVEFWHNAVQGLLYPIPAPAQKIKVTILPPAE